VVSGGLGRAAHAARPGAGGVRAREFRGHESCRSWRTNFSEAAHRSARRACWGGSYGVRVDWRGGNRGRRTRGGDPAQPGDFGAFYLDYYPRILRFFAYHTRDGQLSLDLTAETFAKAFAARERFRGSTTMEAAGWLWAIARNELLLYRRNKTEEWTALRKLGLEAPQASEDEAQRIVERAALDAERGLLEDAYALLTDRQREVIDLRVIQELSFEEIAARLQVSAPVAEQRLASGLQRLARTASMRRIRRAQQ
jgi:RNA polymerase sigma factor (sigma-70 family)